MSNFSTLIITHNEEKIIAKCISKALEVSDDVVVIDSYSTDQTKTICQRLGAKVIQQKWLGYSAQKNFGHQHCKYNWILSLDADEILSDQCIQSLNELELTKTNTAFKINRLNNYCGQWIKHGRWYPEWRTRLFHKNQMQWNSDLVHEDLEWINKNEKNFYKKIKGDVYHYSMQSVEEHYEKIEKYARLSAEKLFLKSKKASIIKRYLSPLSRFLVDYVVKLGFLDGKIGFTIARLNAYETYLKYKKLKQKA